MRYHWRYTRALQIIPGTQQHQRRAHPHHSCRMGLSAREVPVHSHPLRGTCRQAGQGAQRCDNRTVAQRIKYTKFWKPFNLGTRVRTLWGFVSGIKSHVFLSAICHLPSSFCPHWHYCRKNSNKKPYHQTFQLINRCKPSKWAVVFSSSHLGEFVSISHGIKLKKLIRRTFFIIN